MEPSGRARGGKARAEALDPAKRREIASRAAKSRWAKKRAEQRGPVVLEGLPVAKHAGALELAGAELPCYVLETGQRVVGPQPKHGQNWHQWLSGQYGLRKLIEHIYKLIGVAKTCHSMHELREKMAELHGRRMVQLSLPLPPPRA